MSIIDTFRSFNERVAERITRTVATMTCAYIFTVIAVLALPQAIHDSFATGFAPLPIVTWVSQAFLQLTLLSVIMVGQTIQARSSEKRAQDQYDAVMEMLQDMREEHAERHEMLIDMHGIMQKLLVPPAEISQVSVADTPDSA